MYVWTNKITYTFLITIFIFSGCGGENSSKETNITKTVKECNSGPLLQKGHITDIITGTNLDHVQVSIATCSTQTDKNGFYSLNYSTKQSNETITYKKNGYLLGSTKIEIKKSKNNEFLNFLEHAMYKYDNHYTYNNKILNNYIDIDTSVSYVDNNKNPYTGELSAQSTVLDNQNKVLLDIFPSGFNGIDIQGNTVSFITYGLISISFNDNNGNAIDLENGEVATLIFNVSSSADINEETLPLWYYNEKTGSWIEEGYAELQNDGSYKGDISHLGIWSLNKIIEEEPGIFRGHLYYEDGTSVKNARVTAIGDNWEKVDLSTDENGLFEIQVIPYSTFKLEAYNMKYRYKAKYNNIIASILPNEIIEN